MTKLRIFKRYELAGNWDKTCESLNMDTNARACKHLSLKN